MKYCREISEDIYSYNVVPIIILVKTIFKITLVKCNNVYPKI